MAGPKVKFTTEAIMLQTIAFVEEFGIEALNARDLAKYIGCSTQPLFRLFHSMENLKAELFKEIEKIYDGYMQTGLAQENPFLGMGLGYIEFARKHKNLFKALFLSAYFAKESMLAFFDDEESREVVGQIAIGTGLSKHSSQQLLRNIWLMTHGIATMLATNEIVYTETEIKKILFQSFTGFIQYFKEHENETNN